MTISFYSLFRSPEHQHKVIESYIMHLTNQLAVFVAGKYVFLGINKKTINKARLKAIESKVRHLLRTRTPSLSNVSQ